MIEPTPHRYADDHALSALGHPSVVSLYLDRCQVDTPPSLVKTVWSLVNARRPLAGDVVDFGAGDARFARHGRYVNYLGFEIDASRCSIAHLPSNARVIHACAFSHDVEDADVCIGNPPYVRNQDLPTGWRQTAAGAIARRTGVVISGLANAWQYFFFLALASTAADGLVAIVIPFEWVSRPSSAALRAYIKGQGWHVSVYRLHDATFDDVLTTASITIIDKRTRSEAWAYFRQGADGLFTRMKSPTGGKRSLLPYTAATGNVVAKRGLSPGTQEYLTLTEGERARCGLRIDIDVVRCITTLRPTSATAVRFTDETFRKDYVDAGKKCWLIRSDRKLSARLQAYLDSVPAEGRQTSTCINRALWWKFTMPEVPAVLMASGFKGTPKIVINLAKVVAVGGVCGIYALSQAEASRAAYALRKADYAGRVVSHSNGLRKLEINQINALLHSVMHGE